MRVNSVFNNFFNNRLGGRYVTVIVLLGIFFIASSFTGPSDRDFRAKHANLVIREIGHRLLLQAGDSTFRVLPVTEIREGTFLLTFENELVFNHDSLLMLTQRLLPKSQFPSGYIVTVHECFNANIVYGFQINNTTPDVLPCRGRSQPSGCYTIEIAFPDLYENVEQKKVASDQPTEERKSFNADPEDTNTKLAALESVKADLKVDVPIPIAIGTEELKTTMFNYPLINLVYGSGMLVVLSVTLLFGRFGKTVTPVRVQNQNHAINKEPVPELGKFLFDVKEQRLLLGSEVISLTDKECKILEMLNNNFGELIPRETLMQEVWINEGVITGRSLDMFVSKLRKKLSSDPELRITNVHGKGYKLEKLL
jgi:hypothetical protein